MLRKRFQPAQLLDPSQVSAGSAAWVAARLVCAASAHRQAAAHAPQWMAILNLTPDSFSDGGRLDELAQVTRAAKRAVQLGATWLDLGAESTRPGALDISADAQLARLLPAMGAIRELPVQISIDTRSATVAAACLEAGAHAINDVSAFADPAMADLCAHHQAQAFLMHMRGTPADMQTRCEYRFLLGEIADEWTANARLAIQAGVQAQRIYFDPGLGFAKTADQSMQLIAHLGCFRALGFPILVGPSRKSFQLQPLPERDAAERDCGTAGAAASCILQGAQIVRLHVGDYWDAARVAAGIEGAGSSAPDLDFTSTL